MIDLIVFYMGGDPVWLSELRSDLTYIGYENLFGEIIYY